MYDGMEYRIWKRRHTYVSTLNLSTSLYNSSASASAGFIHVIYTTMHKHKCTSAQKPLRISHLLLNEIRKPCRRDDYTMEYG